MSESPDYRVRFRDRALEDLGATFDYIRQESQSQERAMAWLDGAYKAAEALQTFPHGYAYAIEDGIMPGTLRQLEYGSYRMIYNVDDAARYVRILRVRHAAMRPATRRELEP